MSLLACGKYYFGPFCCYYFAVETNIYNSTTRKFTVATMQSLVMAYVFKLRCKPIVTSGA